MAYVLFLAIRVSFTFCTIRAGARDTAYSLLLEAVLVVGGVGGIRIGVGWCAHYGYAGGYGGGVRLAGGGDVLEDLPFAGVVGVLLDVLADGELGGGWLGYDLNVTKTYTRGREFNSVKRKIKFKFILKKIEFTFT